MSARTFLLPAACILALAGLARGPLHRATFGLPVSNDDAIPLLMARHLLRGEFATTLWNQPYNGALDAYLLAPGLALGPAHGIFRGYEAGCAALLVLLVFVLARAIGGRAAGWAAAGFAAFGTPYMGLMTATGPPPNFLMPLVTGLPLAVALVQWRASDEAAGGVQRPGPLACGALGVVSGLAIWNSSLAIPAFVGMAVGLVLAGAKVSRHDRLRAVAFAAGALLGASPLLLARLSGASGTSVVTAASAVTALRPPWLWPQGLSDLGHALTGLLGLQVPLVVDGPERASLPLPVSLGLGLALVLTCGLGAQVRRALPLLGWAGALASAFALSRRTGPDELRYLYGLNAPLLALVGIGAARLFARRRGVALVLGAIVLGSWALGHRLVLQAWRDPAHAARVWQVPSLAPTLATLTRAHAESAYASLQFAGRLTLESDERVIASQAWNERIPGDPLRFRDEVDLDPRAVWVLSPHLSRGMPRADGFRELLRGLGGSWREEAAGDLMVFRSFRPPYDESRPVPRETMSLSEIGGGPLGSAVLDRDPSTQWSASTGLRAGAGLDLQLDAPRRLDALVLAVDVETSPATIPWLAELDGRMAAEGPARQGLQWVNGAPRAARQALLVVPLRGQSGQNLRLLFQGSGAPLRLVEVFLYGPDEAERPRAGQDAADRAFRAAREGGWSAAAQLYAEAVGAEPERASHLAALLRARWRASHRQRFDVESLTDGGPPS